MTYKVTVIGVSPGLVGRFVNVQRAISAARTFSQIEVYRGRPVLIEVEVAGRRWSLSEWVAGVEQMLLWGRINARNT